MVKKFAVVFFVLAMLSVDLGVSALSPPICYHTDSCSPKELCEFENTSENWPEHTGYYRDCGTLSAIPDKRIGSVTTLAVAAVGLLIIGGLGQRYFKAKKKKNPETLA